METDGLRGKRQEDGKGGTLGRGQGKRKDGDAWQETDMWTVRKERREKECSGLPEQTTGTGRR